MHNSSEKKKSPPTIKKASSAVFWFLRVIFRPALYLLYRHKFEMKTSQGIRRPCLILANHQTVFDQFAVGLGFKFGINYVANEDIFRHGLLSRMMVFLSQPIAFSKGTSDFLAVKNMVTVVKDGGCVGMFPSGNRSFFGMESTIVPGIGKLAKKLNVPLVLVQVRGGFNTLARWKAKPSLGKMRAAVSRVVSPQEMAAMTSAGLDDIIQRELRFNEFEYNKTARIAYRGRRRAEYLESALFWCPQCDSMSGLYSRGNDFCCECGARVMINETGFFERVDRAGNIPDTILEWSRLQLDYIKSFDYSGYADKPVFSDDNIAFSRAERAAGEHLLGTGTMALYDNRMVVCGQEFLFAETTMAVFGVRKMTIYNRGSIYSVLAPFRTNLVKYMICGYHVRNTILGVKDEYYGY